MTLQELENIFQSLVDNDEELSAIRKKITEGKATFKDTAAYNERTSTLLGHTLSKHYTDIPKDKRKDVCEKLLYGRYIDINEKLAVVQTSLDEVDGIHISPQRPKFPAERVRKVAGALEDKTASEEVIRRRANGPVANVSKSFHDDYTKRNAEFRSKAGLQCYIDRDAAPGCCAWCSELAGRYVYGDEPEEVYHRHDNCSCTTIYENGRVRQEVWSKIKWEVPEPGAGAAPLTVLDDETRPTGFQPRILASASKPAGWKPKVFNSAGKSGGWEPRVLTKIVKDDIIQTRAMADGMRRSVDYILDETDIHFVLQEAEAIGVPSDVLLFNKGDRTGFRDSWQLITVRGDIFPDEESHNNRDQLSVRAVLAHEYYGHYLAYPSPYAIDDWRDEFYASYRAAIDAPNLSAEDRARLIIDAYDRPRREGVFLDYDEEARQILNEAF